MSELAAQVKMEVDSQPPPPPPDTPAMATAAGAAGAASLVPTGAQPVIVNTPQEMDEEEKESIEDLLNSLEDFVPAVRSLSPPIHIKSFHFFVFLNLGFVTQIPDEVVNYYLTKTGFMCSDEKMYTILRSWLRSACSS